MCLYTGQDRIMITPCYTSMTMVILIVLNITEDMSDLAVSPVCEEVSVH